MEDLRKLLRRVALIVVTTMAVFVVAVNVLLALGWAGTPQVAERQDIEPPDIADLPNPVGIGEPLPEGYRQLLDRDAIAPLYHPVHVAADAVAWDEDTLVLGVAIDGEARAYPIRSLNRREIVNDRIAETPVLASW